MNKEQVKKIEEGEKILCQPRRETRREFGSICTKCHRIKKEYVFQSLIYRGGALKGVRVKRRSDCKRSENALYWSIHIKDVLERVKEEEFNGWSKAFR